MTLPKYEQEFLGAQAITGITVVGSRLRSVNLERDVPSAEIDDIYVGGRAVDALNRVVTAIEDSARTRAWSLTGPYGSGKSTLALLIEVLLGTAGERRQRAEQVIADASPTLAQRISVARDQRAPEGFLTAVATARKEPITKTLTRALFSCANRRWPAGKTPRRIAASLKAFGMPGAGNAEFLTALEALCDESPVLLLIDEFGKALEYLAVRQDADDTRDDMFLLQEIAEAGAGQAGLPLFTMTLQHLSFLDYASRSGALQRREWAKIQGRFEDITYRPDLVDAVQLIRHSLSHRDVPGVSRQLIQQYGTVTADAWSQQGLDGVLAADPGLFGDLYPLHPLTAVAAPLLAAQIGQHDRTLTGFMASDEPHTVQRFLADSPADTSGLNPTVRLPQLYDYFLASGRTTMLVSANAGRWIEIDLVLSQANGLSTEDLQLLKTIALLNLIDASGALRASPSLLLFALDSPSNNNDVAHKTLLDRLDKLTERGFLVYRQFSDEYRIWQGTDVDLATRISEIRERCDDHAVAKMLSTHLPAAVVAGRHSQRTGMLRYFITTVTDPATEVVNGPAVDDPADGIMIFHFGTEDDVPRVRSSVPAVVGITEKASNVIEVGRQLLSLKELLSADVLDAVARSEIGERAGQTESELAAAMAGAFSPAQTATRWFLLDGTGTENAGQRAVAGNLPLVERSLAGVVSAACEIAYPHTPHIRNEMLGRYQLTSQGAKARRELLTAMLTRSAGARLGIEGYGPERAMYEGVLAYLGLHGPKADDHITDVPLTGWGYTEPADTDTLAPAWRALRAYLAQSNGEHPVDALVRLLMAPPYGVKAGVIPVIIWAAMILSADDMAIFEDGTYQPTLTPELIERLIKAPARYSVKYVPVNEGQRHLVLEKLATELGIDTSTGRPTSYRNPALLVITRQLLDHVRGLTNYATRTRRISDSAISVRQALAAARDPDDLLFTALPEALGLDAIHAVDAPDETSAVRYANGLTGALAEIGEVDAKLRAEVVEILSRELQLPRELPSLRRSLAERSVGFANAVVEPDLRGFIGLALNDSLADEDWLDPVAVRIARAGLASWTDEHPRLFANNARKIGNAFDRLSHLYRAGVDESGATKTSVQLLTLMRHDGNEARVLVQAPKAVRDAASSLAVKVIEEAESELGPGGGRVLAAALATALADRPTADEDPSSEANPYG